MAGDPEQEVAYRTGDLGLFESGIFSDVVVKCGSRSWNLHRNILCTRSVWFNKALCGRLLEATEKLVRIREQEPEAVEVCLKYIYGGAIDMATETRFRPVFKFCAEIYRSADFFLLKPLLLVVQRHIGDYCDERTRWMWTRGNIVEDDRNGKKALVWVNDLKAAILETNKWNTPVINLMLMEFVWASQDFLTTTLPIHISIADWLRENARGFSEDMADHCDTTSPFSRTWRKWTRPPVWTPKPCKTRVPDSWCNTCVRCGSKLERYDWTKKSYGQLRDPFNSSGSCRHAREWCRECAAEIKYPWREDGYL